MNRRGLSIDRKDLAMALHDLRQPLQSISLLNAALLRQVDEEAAVRMLRLQGESIATMCSQLNELLESSKPDRGSPDHSPERSPDLSGR